MITLTAQQEVRAAALHHDALIIDTLSGEPTVFTQAMLARLEVLVARQIPTDAIYAAMERMAADALLRGDLPEYWEWWDASGVNVISNTVRPFGRIPFSYEAALEGLALMTRKFDGLDRLVKVTRATDVRRGAHHPAHI